MSRYKSFFILLAGLFQFTSFGQTGKIKGKLRSDTADISVVGIYPDSFPDVSVIFKAETRKGIPLWNLPKEKISVLENDLPCELISLCPVSGKKPLHIALVIDHSGSMAEDLSMFFHPDGSPRKDIVFDDLGFPVHQQEFQTPLQKAKKAVLSFVQSLEGKDELISVIGFSAIVDKILPLTSDREKIRTTIEGMEPDFSTACYDGIREGLNQLQKSDGIRVVIALTDGQDNSSKTNWEELVKIAKKEKIPVYTIGLGLANGQILNAIAGGTGGRYFFSRNSASLDTIYKTISNQVQAYYELVYRSANLKPSDSTRSVSISFESDSLLIFDGKASSRFPASLIRLVEEKQKLRNYAMSGISVVALTIGISLFFTFRKKKKAAPRLRQLYPNPNQGRFTLDFEMSEEGELRLYDAGGTMLRSAKAVAGTSEFDFQPLPDGEYRLIMHSSSGRSNALNLLIRN